MMALGNRLFDTAEPVLKILDESATKAVIETFLQFQFQDTHAPGQTIPQDNNQPHNSGHRMAQPQSQPLPQRMAQPQLQRMAQPQTQPRGQRMAQPHQLHQEPVADPNRSRSSSNCPQQLTLKILQSKLNVHVRIHSVPAFPGFYRADFPGCKVDGNFLALFGTVTRIGTAKILEYAKSYECSVCGTICEIPSKPSRCNAFPKKITCPYRCHRSKMVALDNYAAISASSQTAGISSISKSSLSKFCDYQEIKLQVSIRTQ
jgi:hypothetical protein